MNSALHKELMKEILRFDPKKPLEEAVTPPSSWYLSEEILFLEKERVFMKNWLGIGDGTELSSKGRFLTGELLDQPYVIVNSEDSTDNLQAFFNVCSHRAAQIASGSGSCNGFSCPYHGWQYNLNGSLIKATSLRGIKNFQAQHHALKPIQVSKLGKTLFLNFSTDMDMKFDKISTPVYQAMKSFLLDHTFSDLTFIARREYQMKANWKLYIENFNDGDYHIPYVHPSLKDWAYSHTDRIEYFNNLILQLSEHADQDKISGLGGVYSYIYPNTMIGRSGDTCHVIIARPVNAHETCMTIDSYIRNDLADNKEAVKECLRFIEILHLEDIAVCESVTKGLKSNGYDVGRYAPSKEKGVNYFHKMLFNDLIKFSDMQILE
jgi:choline monooxygenase